MTSGNTAPHDPYAPLRYPNFRWLVLAHGTSTVAREAQIVVVAWQIYEVTKDPLSLGLIGLSEALPFVAVALYAGHVADRRLALCPGQLPGAEAESGNAGLLDVDEYHAASASALGSCTPTGNRRSQNECARSGSGNSF